MEIFRVRYSFALSQEQEGCCLRNNAKLRIPGVSGCFRLRYGSYGESMSFFVYLYCCFQGVAQSKDGAQDFSIWSVVKDLTNKQMYYRGYDYLSIRRVSLDNIPDKVASITLDDDFFAGVEDVTNKLKVQVKSEL